MRGATLAIALLLGIAGGLMLAQHRRADASAKTVPILAGAAIGDRYLVSLARPDTGQYVIRYKNTEISARCLGSWMDGRWHDSLCFPLPMGELIEMTGEDPDGTAPQGLCYTKSDHIRTCLEIVGERLLPRSKGIEQ